MPWTRWREGWKAQLTWQGRVVYTASSVCVLLSTMAVGMLLFFMLRASPVETSAATGSVAAFWAFLKCWQHEHRARRAAEAGPWAVRPDGTRERIQDEPRESR